MKTFHGWVLATLFAINAGAAALAAGFDKSAVEFIAPAGSYVVHYGNKVHYDGAKGEGVVIQVTGMGPATATPVDKR